jgi:ribonucleoside-triphosphate reductase
LRGEQPRCSHCDQETEIYSRVVGYLRPVKQWNDGKQAEYDLRRTYRTDSITPGVSAAVTIKPPVQAIAADPPADRLAPQKQEVVPQQVESGSR